MLKITLYTTIPRTKMEVNRYNNGKVYKLVNSVDNRIYVGSTISSLAKRKNEHKSKARKYPDRHAYAHLNSIGWRNVRIILIETYHCSSKDELCAREQYYINLLNPSLNKNSAIDDCPHGRIKALCVECGGSSICEHARIKSRCVQCEGGSICEHGIQKANCKECSGIDCEFCNTTTSKGKLKRHCRGPKHRNNYKRVFLETFGLEITNDDVPEYI